jgi:hypothetical protein
MIFIMFSVSKEELNRSGRFNRIFPTENMGYLYSSFISKVSLNWQLHVALFGKITVLKPKPEDSGAWKEDKIDHKSKSYANIYSKWKKKNSIIDLAPNAPWDPQNEPETNAGNEPLVTSNVKSSAIRAYAARAAEPQLSATSKTNSMHTFFFRFN